MRTLNTTLHSHHATNIAGPQPPRDPPRLARALEHAEIRRPAAAHAVAQAILGEANIMSAAICQVTDQQPTEVCSSAGVKAAATKLGSG